MDSMARRNHWLRPSNATESRLGSPSTDSECFGNWIFLGKKGRMEHHQVTVPFLHLTLWTHPQSTILSVPETNAKETLILQTPPNESKNQTLNLQR